MCRRWIVAGLFAGLCVLGSTKAVGQSSYTAGTEVPKPATPEPFALLRHQWAGNLREKKVEASVAEYTADAEFIQPDRSVVKGAAALRKLYQTVTATYDSDLIFQSGGVESAGDHATDKGSYREVLTERATGKRQLIHGSYVTEYLRSAGGWLIARQSWTMEGAPVLLDLDPHPVVALTYDDLPAAGQLPPGETRAGIALRLTGELKAAHLEGTYGFVNAKKLENKSDERQALHIWVDSGMNIGSHTWSHPPLNGITEQEFEAEIEQNEPALAEYAQTRDWRWFRYPFLWEGDSLKKRRAVRAYLAAHHYRVAQVTLDFEDYAWNDAYSRCSATKDTASLQWLHDSYLATAAEYIELGREEELIAFGHEIPNVLLLHETAFTTEMTPEIISLLKKQGFRFASLAEVESDPAYALDPDTALKYGGTLPDQFMDSRYLPYPPVKPKPMDKLEKICQ